MIHTLAYVVEAKISYFMKYLDSNLILIYITYFIKSKSKFINSISK